MISASRTNLKFPLTDVASLYWIAPARDAAGPYSPASFYFASADGSTLVPAIADEERFITALTSEIASLAGLPCVVGLQALLNELTVSAEPPAPRYPAIGDTNVKGQVLAVYDGPWFEALRSATPPPGYDPDTWKGPLWMGIVIADIESNGYSTPPASLVDSGPLYNAFRFQFKSSTEVVCGPCTFDIVLGKNVAVATNVVLA